MGMEMMEVIYWHCRQGGKMDYFNGVMQFMKIHSKEMEIGI
jgi:hypothetical protein